MKKSLYMMAILLVTSLLLQAQNNNGIPIQATTDRGVIEGLYETKSGLQTYFGVPFAKPPVGNLRWKAPQPMDNWKGVLNTKTFGPRPVQAIVFGDMNSRSNGL